MTKAGILVKLHQIKTFAIHYPGILTLAGSCEARGRIVQFFKSISDCSRDELLSLKYRRPGSSLEKRKCW